MRRPTHFWKHWGCLYNIDFTTYRWDSLSPHYAHPHPIPPISVAPAATAARSQRSDPRQRLGPRNLGCSGYGMHQIYPRCSCQEKNKLQTAPKNAK